MLGNVQQIYLFLSKQYHNAHEALLCGYPKSVDPLEILRIYVQLWVSQHLCDHVLTKEC